MTIDTNADTHGTPPFCPSFLDPTRRRAQVRPLQAARAEAKRSRQEGQGQEEESRAGRLQEAKGQDGRTYIWRDFGGYGEWELAEYMEEEYTPEPSEENEGDI